MSQYGKKYTMNGSYLNVVELQSFLLDFFVTTNMEPSKIYLSGDLFFNFCQQMSSQVTVIAAEKGKEYTPKILTQFGYLPVYPKNITGLVNAVIIDLDEQEINKAMEKMLRGED